MLTLNVDKRRLAAAARGELLKVFPAVIFFFGREWLLDYGVMLREGDAGAATADESWPIADLKELQGLPGVSSRSGAREEVQGSNKSIITLGLDFGLMFKQEENDNGE
ncbi:hypothetical protein AXG93_2603s1000 [Marchantia polymorpha subsp. ruderalis]|uniref:Uncharacterized protein n=1 Tax=Marchantia polymorpha subsp. ruderalis TaxID=1480154 RepID=A0A176VMP3_MARPO|nr:hypothetical protein AXG93_2603s1000 [Marchantia polymorpha subsp. ruderalis]